MSIFFKKFLSQRKKSASISLSPSEIPTGKPLAAARAARAVRPRVDGAGSTDLERVLIKARQILSLVCVALLIYIALSLTVWKPQRLVQTAALRGNSDGSAETFPVSQPSSRTFADYGTFIKDRDIFGGARAAESSVETAPPVQNFNTNHLKIVGIMIDKDPTVIVENANTQETLFLSVGEKIGEMELKEIREGKAIFSLGNSRIELTPQ